MICISHTLIVSFIVIVSVVGLANSSDPFLHYASDWNDLCSAIKDQTSSSNTIVVVNHTIQATSLCIIPTNPTTNRTVTIQCEGSLVGPPHIVCEEGSVPEDKGGGCFEVVVAAGVEQSGLPTQPPPVLSSTMISTIGCRIHVGTVCNGYMRTRVVGGGVTTSMVNTSLTQCILSSSPTERDQTIHANIIDIVINDDVVLQTAMLVSLHIHNCEFRDILFSRDTYSIVAVTPARSVSTTTPLIRVELELVSVTVHDVTFRKGGGILSIDPVNTMASRYRPPLNQILIFTLRDLKVWNVWRGYNGFLGTSGLIAIVGDTWHTDDTETSYRIPKTNGGFRSIQGSMVHIQYSNSTGRMLFISGGWNDTYAHLKYDVHVDDVFAWNIASPNQHGSIIHTCSWSRVTIGTMVTRNTSTTWKGGVLMFWDDTTCVAENVTSYDSHADDAGGVVALWDNASVCIQHLAAYNVYAEIQ
eukprot:PhF_6_TR41264/c0_g1_i7/m.62362